MPHSDRLHAPAGFLSRLKSPRHTNRVVATRCTVIPRVLNAGLAAVCPNNDCTGLRATQGPGGSTVWQQWVPGESVQSTIGGVTYDEGTYKPGHWETVATNETTNDTWGWAWIPGLAPGANGLLQAVKAATRQVKPSPQPVLPEVPGTAPEIQLEDPFMKRVVDLMTKWLRGGGLGSLPPSTILVLIVSPCAVPSFQNTQMCGGNIY
jgi:hypothetical protein